MYALRVRRPLLVVRASLLLPAFSVFSVVKAGFPGAVIEGVNFVDCILRGVWLVQNRER